MALLTYTAEITAPASQTLPTTGSPYPIPATITQSGFPTNTVIVTFYVITPISSNNMAQVTAVFASPIWPISTIIEGVSLTTTSYTLANPGGSIWNPSLGTVVTSITSSSSAQTPSITTTTVPNGQPSISGQSTSSSSQSTNTSLGASILPGTGASAPSPTESSSSSTTHSSLLSATQSSLLSAQSHDKFSSAELGGTAVGCLIAGILLSAFAIALFFRRLNLRKVRSAEHNDKEGNVAWQKPPTVEVPPRSILRIKGVSTRNQDFPQQEPDDFIRRIASRTLDEIEIFVEEFYTDKLASNFSSPGVRDSSLLNSPHLNGTASHLLSTSAEPIKIIKHCVIYFLLQQITNSDDERLSLLPSKFKAIQSNTRNAEAQAVSDKRAFSQLRGPMASTRQGPDLDSNYQAQQERVVTVLVDRIESTFQPWSRGDATTRLRALKGVIIHVSELGIKLFSQPSLFQWIWGQPSSQLDSMPGESRSIILAPGLSKVTDQDGEILTPPLVLLSARVAH